MATTNRIAQALYSYLIGVAEVSTFFGSRIAFVQLDRGTDFPNATFDLAEAVEATHDMDRSSPAIDRSIDRLTMIEATFEVRSRNRTSDQVIEGREVLLRALLGGAFDGDRNGIKISGVRLESADSPFFFQDTETMSASFTVSFFADAVR